MVYVLLSKLKKFRYFFYRLLPQKVQLLQVYVYSIPCEKVPCLGHFGPCLHCYWGPSSSALELLHNFLDASRVFTVFKCHMFFEHHLIYIYLLCSKAHSKFVNWFLEEFHLHDHISSQFKKMILGCRNFPFLFIFMRICSVLC